jgi:hypothetical protein
MDNDTDRLSLLQADALQKQYRFSTKVDTISLLVRTVEPTTRAAVKALTGGFVLGYKADPAVRMSEDEREQNVIWAYDEPSLHFRAKIQDPKIDRLQDDVLAVAGAYGLRDVQIKRLDLAFDAKVKGQSGMTQDEIAFRLEGMKRLARAALVPLSDNHDWRMVGDTYYCGHERGNLIRVYFKQSDDGVALEPPDWTCRIEVSIGRSRLSRKLGLSRFADLADFKWSRLAKQIRFRLDGKPIQALNNKLGYAVDRCAVRDWAWTRDDAAVA